MFIFAVFQNRNETLQFISELKRIGVNAILTSTPKGLGSSCSVSAKFYQKDMNKALYVLRLRNYSSFKNFFKLITKDNRAVFEIFPVNFY